MDAQVPYIRWHRTDSLHTHGFQICKPGFRCWVNHRCRTQGCGDPAEFAAPFWFPDSSIGKESACVAKDLGLIPGLGRSLGEGKGYPLQYSGLDNSMDCIVHEITESDTTEQLSLSLFWL